MALQRTPYTPFLLLVGGLLIAFAGALWYLGREDETPGTRLGSLLMFAGAAWVFLFTIQLSSTTLAAKVFWRVVTDAAVLCLTVVWLAYVLWYTGRSEWLPRWGIGLLCLFPASLLAIAASPGTRRVLFSDAELVRIGSFVVLEPTHSPIFAGYLVVGYALLVGSLLLLGSAAMQARGILRWQIAVLLSFATLPGCAVLVDLSGYAPVPGLNLGPMSVAVTAVAGAFSIARFEWLDLTPIARDRVFRSIADAVVVFDTVGRVVDLNPSAERLVGESASDAVGRHLADLVPELATLVDAPDAVDVSTRSEVTIDTDDGRRVFDMQLSSVSPSVGDRTGHALILRDITARKAAEDRAARRSRKIEQLLRVVNDLTAARTVGAVFQRAVDGGHDVFGADVCRIAVADDGRFVPAASSADEAVDDLPARPIDAGFAGVTYRSGTPVRVDDLTDTRHASSRSGGTSGSASSSSSEPTYRSLLSAPIGDRGVVQLLSSDSAAFDEDDRETVALFASHVETAVDRAEAEADLRAERDRLDEFAGVVAHDLRNPLTIASGRAELLADDAHAPAEHVAPLRTALSRMESIITDILTLARQGETVGGTERVDLSACVDDAWASVDTDRAELRRTGGLGHVHADRGRLQELFENLFRNSVEHGSTDNPTSSVTVRVGRLDDAAGFYVADDGPGIPEDRRASVFEYGHSSADAGTGIGLAVVERIAHAHDWEVEVVDAADGGARFEITVE